jgi:hypothetical protein
MNRAAPLRRLIQQGRACAPWCLRACIGSTPAGPRAFVATTPSPIEAVVLKQAMSLTLAPP